MTSDFSCEYKMHAPMTGCDVHITVVRKGTDAPVMKYELKEKTDGYQKSGEITEDDQKDQQTKVQKTTDKFVKLIDEAVHFFCYYRVQS